jgi:hypothetical protein
MKNKLPVSQIGSKYIACNVNGNCLVLRRIDDRIFTIENFQYEIDTTEEEIETYLIFS